MKLVAGILAFSQGPTSAGLGISLRHLVHQIALFEASLTIVSGLRYLNFEQNQVG